METNKSFSKKVAALPCALALTATLFLMQATAEAEETGAAKPNAVEKTSEEAFAQSRAPFAGRPRPNDLTLDKPELDKYIASLPEELRAAEAKRGETVASAKAYLVRLFDRNAYYDKEAGVLVKEGQVSLRRHVKISMANEKYLLAKSSPEAPLERIKWEDLDFRQNEVLFEYFIAQRLASVGGVVDKKESTDAAAEDCLVAAALCDWNGRYGKALEFAKRAVSLDPELEEEAEAFLATGAKGAVAGTPWTFKERPVMSEEDWKDAKKTAAERARKLEEEKRAFAGKLLGLLSKRKFAELAELLEKPAFAPSEEELAALETLRKSALQLKEISKAIESALAQEPGAEIEFAAAGGVVEKGEALRAKDGFVFVKIRVEGGKELSTKIKDEALTCDSTLRLAKGRIPEESLALYRAAVEKDRARALKDLADGGAALEPCAKLLALGDWSEAKARKTNGK